jgi:hypothetical protein
MMEASFCSCDQGDWPEVFEKRVLRARKRYRCCECGSVIGVGEMYERVSGLWDGRWARYKTCVVCARIRRDYCAPFGYLRETIWEGLGTDIVGVWGE